MLVGLTLLPRVSFSDCHHARVLPPDTHAFGQTYEEWSARWWQWAISMPSDHNPLADTADCSMGQVGPVWFLGGSFAQTPLTGPRKCTVPPGKGLFFPIVDVDCSSMEAPPFHGDTPAERIACARGLIDGTAG